MRTVADIGYPTENGEYEIRLAPYHRESRKAIIENGRMKIEGTDINNVVESVLYPRDMWTKLN